jgi:hypothetical protein
VEGLNFERSSKRWERGHGQVAATAQGSDDDIYSSNDAAGAGHTAVCAYLRSQACPWDSTACYRAACGQHYSTLQWLHTSGCPYDATVACEQAATCGHTDTVEFILQLHGTALSDLPASQLTGLLNAAGAYNKVAAAQWLRQQGAEWPEQLVYTNKYVWTKVWTDEALRWARAEGCTSPTCIDYQVSSHVSITLMQTHYAYSTMLHVTVNTLCSIHVYIANAATTALSFCTYHKLIHVQV